MNALSDRPQAATGRLRVLAVAAACHPDRGSEPGLGWGWVQSLAARHDVWAIVGEREGNRPAILSRLDADPVLRKHLHVFFVPRPSPSRLEQLVPLLYYRQYARWHWQAYLLARDLASATSFDLAHQVNMIGYREPGYLWQLGLPFVWGPIDGATNMPLRFWRFLGLRGAAYYLAYDMVNTWQLHFNSRVRAALSRANGLVVASEDMRHRLARVWGVSSVLIHDTGPVEMVQAKAVVRQPDEPLRLAWSGIHVSRKALPILLHALSELPPGLCHVEILGAGSCTGSWQRLARRLGVADSCTWHGRLTRDRALEVMQGAHAFALTSLRDATSTVLMEALSLGLPVICLDHCGFSDVVTESCGIKIPPRPAALVVDRFAAAIRCLASDPDSLERLSHGALERAAGFSWDAHAEDMTRVYRLAIERWHSARSQTGPEPLPAVTKAGCRAVLERSGCYGS